MLENKNEKIDKVPGTDYEIIQNRERFSYGTDAIFLSEFAKPKGIVVDLGTGTGIIPIRLVGRNHKIEKVYGIEIQDEVYDMARRSVELNHIDKIEILNMDLKDLPEKFGKEAVDTVVTNPPYMKSGSALVNEDDNFAISRHEISCNLEDIIRVSSHILKSNGKFFMVHRPDRLVDIIYHMRNYRLEPKRLRFVYPKVGKKSNLILIEGSKYGKVDLKMENPLIIYNEDGSYTEDIMKIYYKDKE